MTEPVIQFQNPATICAPFGLYSNVARVRAAQTTIYIAGMVAVDRAGQCVGVGDIAKQVEQVFENIRLALEVETLTWGNIAQFTTYLTDAAYIGHFAAWRNANFPKMFADASYPPNTLLIVNRLLREEFLIEVQTIAVT